MIYLTDYNKTWMPMEGAFVEIFDSAALEEKLDIEIYNMSPSKYGRNYWKRRRTLATG